MNKLGKMTNREEGIFDLCNISIATRLYITFLEAAAFLSATISAPDTSIDGHASNSPLQVRDLSPTSVMT